MNYNMLQTLVTDVSTSCVGEPLTPIHDVNFSSKVSINYLKKTRECGKVMYCHNPMKPIPTKEGVRYVN